MLTQVGLAVSVGLGVDGDQLQWLARALHRVASCDGANSLVWELCEDVAAHVKRRFIVEAGVRAALLPRDDAPLGLLFHPQPCSNAGGLGRCRAPEPGQGLSRSARSSVECGAWPPTGSQQAAGQPGMLPCGKLGVQSGMASRNRLSVLTASSGPGSECGATSRPSKRPASTHLFGEPSASGRVLTLCSGDALPSRSADPHQHPAATASLPASRTTIVVQLPPHVAVEAPSTSLHAQAFSLKHTALQALAAGGGCGTSIGGGGGGSFQGTCIDDMASYLQNVHNPSRDVCLLLGGLRAGPPASPRTPLATTAPLHPGAGLQGGVVGGSSAGSSPVGGCGSLQSLVLVGLRLGDSVLAFYLCFSKHLPGELLQAVRVSCNELLSEVFAGPIRAKLEGSLAAEFETLRSTTPGNFAVLRSASLNGLLHYRPGSQGSIAMRAARLIAPPRASCGVSLQAKTMSGCYELAATPGTTAAGAAGAGVMATAEGVPCGTASRLPHVDISCSSQAEITLFTGACGARGTGFPRTTSFSTDRGGDGGGARGPPGQPTTKELPQLALANEELMSVLMQMRQSETACSQGDPRSTSIMTVTAVDAASCLRHQLDILVTSIQTTMTTEVHGAMVAFSDDLESLELLDVLGKGGGGVVYLGRLGTQEVAVKVMELPDLDAVPPQQQQLAASPSQQVQVQATPRCGAGGDGADGALAHSPSPAAAAAAAKEQLRSRRALLRNAMEMAVQGRVSHPNLIQVYATYSNVLVERRSRADGSTYHCLVPADMGVHDLGLPAPSVACCAIVAELADCGSLAAALASRAFPRVMSTPRVCGTEQHPFQLDMRAVYMSLLDVALALRHLHSLNLVHRDIKPANLLLKSNPRDHRGFTVKLADFGFVLQLTETAEDGSRYVMVDQACGTVTHMAPELLPGKARVDTSADVYSFGILMWEMLSDGVRPFPHLHPDHIPRHVYKGARPVFRDMAPLTYRGLAHACWSAELHRRPKAADLVAIITSQMQELE